MSKQSVSRSRLSPPLRDAERLALSPCPFCMEQADLVVDGGPSPAIMCTCGASGPLAESEETASAAWNERAPPSQQSDRPSLDPIVEARLTDILGDLAQASASIDVAACVLADSDAGLCGNVEAPQLGLSLKIVHRRLLEVMDRLDCVNLCDPSRRLVVRTPEEREVLHAA